MTVIASNAKITLGETDVVNTAILTVLYGGCSIYSWPCMCLFAWVLKFLSLSLSCLYVLYVYVHVGMCMLVHVHTCMSACGCQRLMLWVFFNVSLPCFFFFFFEGFPLNLELIYLPMLTDQGQGSTCLRLHRTIKAVPHLAWVFMWVLEPQSQVLMLFASQAL